MSNLISSSLPSHCLKDFGEDISAVRGVLASESGTKVVDVREKLDTRAKDSGKDEYDVRTELGAVSDVEAYELRAEYGCESVAEM
jgi:hypothetical protein